MAGAKVSGCAWRGRLWAGGASATGWRVAEVGADVMVVAAYGLLLPQAVLGSVKAMGLSAILTGLHAVNQAARIKTLCAQRALSVCRQCCVQKQA